MKTKTRKPLVLSKESLVRLDHRQLTTAAGGKNRIETATCSRGWDCSETSCGPFGCVDSNVIC